jgi:RNA recognition motif-containing protein
MPTRIFVGNFDESVDENDLESLFLLYGPVKKTSVRWDPRTRKSQGFGFVEMEHEEKAEIAVKNVNGQWWRGRQLEVRFAKPRQRGPL